MNVDKIRNLTDVELNHQQRELADQLFKMKFQLKMGQTESLKKIRELKKDIARVNTVMREKQIAAGNGAGTASTSAPVATPAPAKAKAEKKVSTKKTAVKKAPAAKKAARKQAATEKK
jgi:large subunit ribosomal protein L29